MKMKKTLSLLLALSLLLGLAPALAGTAAAAGERRVSPWAEEEIARAECYGLLDVGDLRADYAQWDSEEVTDWTQPITRAMFLRFALSYAAVMNHSDRGCFQNAVNRLISERSEDGYFLKHPFSDDQSDEAAAAYALCVVNGRVDTISAPALLEVFENNYDEITKVRIDAKTLEYISSAGLRVLLATQKIMDKQGEMTLTNVSEAVREIFEVTGFTDILTIV